ncbi:hypothetical protein CHS0354_018011 [Potamilus streckersoni]|uniref:TIR domain-containing protein n=1 Tax=Potamilus streckersoni TaxID=2493646 RepID=A0AAE0RN78_9BIVA|nr:hypothetical protein CHS0354_018011 [Potamilus streckersoni]
MQFRRMFGLAVAIVIVMSKLSVAICYSSCPCVHITNVSTICNITYNVANRPISWQDFFEIEVTTIQKLDLIFNISFEPQLFPWQEFFQFNWYSLQELQVQNFQADDTENINFQMAYLENMPNLTKLVLRLRPINLIPGSVQSPLHLSFLDVSYNGHLDFDNLVKIISVSGTALEELYANYINDFNSAVLDDLFFKYFEKTKLRIIHAVDSNIKIIASPNISNFLPFLEEIDISQNDVDIYESTFFSARYFKTLKRFYGPNTLVISLRQDKCVAISRKDRREPHLCVQFSFMTNELKSLKTLLLNGNELYRMENSNPDEFTNLTRRNGNLMTFNLSSNGLVKLPSDFFAFNKELNTLNLSSNRFSYLPEGIFANNPRLEILDLSNNLLSVTDWLSSNLINLRVLNIRNNRIATLDSETRNLLDIRSFIMFLAYNPLDCSCENNDLSVWLSNKKAPTVNITEVFCTQTGISLSSHINKIESFIYECKLKRYVGLFGLLTIPAIMAICAVYYYRHYQNILRIRRIRKQLKDFVEENVAPQQRFLLYLAYSFADSETVLKHIFPELESRLQRELNVVDKLVCISDRDFDVGTSISDEIIRAVSSCTVVLFVISKEFASSRWCEFESEIAIYEQKPIIIVVLEQIKIKLLPSSLRKVCYKWTRMEWPGKEDVNKLDDFWNKLTKAVIKCSDVKY